MKRYHKRVTGSGTESAGNGLTITHNSVGSARVSRNGREICAVWPKNEGGGFAYGPVTQITDKGCSGERMESSGTAGSVQEAARKLAERDC